MAAIAVLALAGCGLPGRVGAGPSPTATRGIVVSSEATPLPTETPVPTAVILTAADISATATAAATASVLVDASSLTPATVTIRQGEAVRWVDAKTGAPVQVQPATAPGSTAWPATATAPVSQYVFSTVGTYAYHPAANPSFTGLVVVQ